MERVQIAGGPKTTSLSHRTWFLTETEISISLSIGLSFFYSSPRTVAWSSFYTSRGYHSGRDA
jgi:hypothetical protein